MSADFTPTERRILSVLSDGRRQGRDRLLACLNDRLASYANLHMHMTRLRKKLRPDQDIVCEFYGGTFHYRHVVLLSALSGTSG